MHLIWKMISNFVYSNNSVFSNQNFQLVKFLFRQLILHLIYIGFPNNGLLNRCPKPTTEHCLKNGTKIAHDELLELKTFLTSTTTRKSKVIKSKKTTNKPKR